ncbi:Vitamin-D-receptor interacting Mediator subunit 4 domain containing protein [Naviculisporaceae sp. PSN 640]
MDKYLDARFERVEKALAVLIDSITKYNPSEKIADDLITSERELASTLQSLEHHQNNFHKIQSLRDENALLDSQIKDTIGSLWNVRKEVKNTQTTIYPPTGPKYNFSTAELLDYARRISHHTLPPAEIINAYDAALATTNTNAAATPLATGQETAEGQTPNTSFNGGTVPNTVVGTPATTAPTPAPADSSQAPLNPSQPPNTQSQSQSQSTAVDMPENLKPFVDRLHGAIFYPWPTEDTIRRGALAAYQLLVDSGIDPKGYDPEEEARRKEAEELARKEADEAARREREEAERRMREERERMIRDRERARQEAERRGSVMEGGSTGATGAGRQQKTQFAFLGGDDEDDDDDE